MIKKIIVYSIYLFIIIYILFAPFYLNNIFSNKYLADTSEEEWSGVITMWDIPRYTVNGSKFGWIKSRISQYHKLHPNVHIELEELHYTDNKTIAFKGALSEDHPDIMPLVIDGESIPLDNVIPIDFLDESDNLISFKDELIGSIYLDEKIWGIPVYYSVNVLIINKDILQTLDIDIPEDFTFDAFIDLLKEINEKDTKNQIIPFDFYLEENEYSYMPFLLSDGGNIFSSSNENVDFYNSKVVTGLQKLKIISENSNNLSHNYGLRSRTEVYQDFFNNTTAIIAGSLDDVNKLIRKQNQGKGFDFIVTPYPKGDSNLPVYFAEEIGSYAIMETEDSGKLKEINKFMQFLLDEDSQNSIEILGKLPSVEGYTYDFTTYPHLTQFNDSSFLHVIPFYTDWKQIANTINNEIKKIFTDNQPTTETLYNIQQTSENILNK